MTNRYQRGFSLIEILLVLAILGVLLGIGFVQIRPPSARTLSNDIKAMIHQARYEAIKRNAPVAFVWDEAAGQFQSRLDSVTPSVATVCSGEVVIASTALSDYPNATVTVSVPTNGIVWLPTGQGRSCTGAPMVSSEIDVFSGSVSRTVEITMGGKVAIQ